MKKKKNRKEEKERNQTSGTLICLNIEQSRKKYKNIKTNDLKKEKRQKTVKDFDKFSKKKEERRKKKLEQQMMMFRNPHATGRFSIVAVARSSEKKRMKR